jgi:hypothetical protein
MDPGNPVNMPFSNFLVAGFYANQKDILPSFNNQSRQVMKYFLRLPPGDALVYTRKQRMFN